MASHPRIQQSISKLCEQWCGKSSCMEQGCENRENYRSVTNALGGGFGNGVVPKNLTKSETAEAVKLVRRD